MTIPTLEQYLASYDEAKAGLLNASFEQGHHLWQNRPELAIPDDWEFGYQTDKSIRLQSLPDPRFPRRVDQQIEFNPPELVNWNQSQAPDNEKPIFFISGTKNIKGFKGNAPTWWWLFQRVRNLIPGRSYRFYVPTYPDLVVAQQGTEKTFADDPLAGEHRLFVRSDTENLADTGWLNGSAVPFGKWNLLFVEFVAPASGEATLYLELRGRWGLLSVGWFIDALSLVAMDSPAPTPTPQPPASGDLVALQAEVARLQGEIAQANLRLSAVDGKYTSTLEALHDTVAVTIANLEQLRVKLAAQLAEVRR